MKISSNQELGLRAALLPPPLNIQSWNRLLSSISITEIDSSITRIFPAIYKNLEGASPITEYPKLKGSYFFAWVKNTEFISNIKPLLMLLEKSSIEYRILKGGALNFLFRSLGTRSMGDIDFLISRVDLDQFKEILKEVGFRKKFVDACSHAPSGDFDAELNYVNEDNIEIDLHVMEDRRPKELFALMLEKPATICDFMGMSIKIPAPEMLVMHAIYHGSLGTQSSDEMQSLLDVRRLTSFVDEARLIKVSDKLHFNGLLKQYLETLFKVTGETFFPQISKRLDRWDDIRHFFDKIENMLLRLMDYPSLHKSRKIDLKNIMKIHRKFQGHRISYCFWVFTSKLRPMERIYWFFLKGFLKSPEEMIQVSNQIEYSRFNALDRVIFSNISEESQDWRFSFRTEPETSRLKISMQSESFKKQSFLVFTNGKFSGVTNKNPQGVHALEVHHPPTRVEVSLRLPTSGCEKCAQKLEDWSLRFSR